MKIAIGADHGGYKLKTRIKEKLGDKFEFLDCGATELNGADDYTVFSFRVAELVASKQADFGVLICRTGVGACIAMNKVLGVRAGALERIKDTELARKKNDINALAIGADLVNEKTAINMVLALTKVPFEGGRHAKRVQDIVDYERAHYEKNN